MRCGACGSWFSYTYSTSKIAAAKNSGTRKRWAYLVCRRHLKQGASACPGSRVAAGEFEKFVLDRIRAIGSDRGVVNATLAACPKGTNHEEVRAALRELDGIWNELLPAERARVLSLLIEEIRFTARTGDTAITFREGAPSALTKS